MGTSKVPLIWKSAHKYSQGTVSLGSHRFANRSESNPFAWIHSVPWPYLWANFKTKGTCEVPMIYKKF